MKRLFIIAAAVLTVVAYMHAEGTRIVAHRGHWNAEGSAQNSIRSLVKADSVGADATEFDVHVTSDGVAVLNHDGVINGCKVIDTPSEIICAQKLENGENVATLRDFLKVAKDLKIDLVLELKWHGTAEREIEAAKICVDLVNEAGLADRTQYISFSSTICNALSQLTDRPVSHLWGEQIDPDKAKGLGATGCDYSNSVWKEHPEYFKRCKELGLITNVWTIDDDESIVRALNDGFDFITTNDPVKAMKLRAQTINCEPCKSDCCTTK